MPRFRTIHFIEAALSTALLALASCAHTPPAPGIPLSYSAEPFDSHAKIFLIAGESGSSAFAHEIAEQRRFWLRRGIRPQEIACFYRAPSPEQRRVSSDLYEADAEQLSHCYLASMQNIAGQLRTSAKNTALGFVYLYITSHGMPPLPRIDPSKVSPQGRANFESKFRSEPVLNQYMISLEAVSQAQESFLGVMRAAVTSNHPDSFLLTPHSLGELLRAFPSALPKYVVIQACYSGGFLDDSSPELRAQTLKGIPALTALTASRYDRTSFGCAPASEFTFYGEAYFNALHDTQGSPLTISWDVLAEGVASSIKLQEANLRMPLEIRSEPQFFTNQ